MKYSIDSSRDIPIYKQVADAILKDIRTGQLSVGTKLPTVRELADNMDLSQGTIKRCYEYLRELGVVEMTQGKGTFVLGEEDENAGSRKDRAMAAIDELFVTLDDLGFTPREMEIYISLKLHGLEEKYDVVKVAVVDCNPETLQLLESQLSQIGYAQIALFSLNQLYEIADKLKNDYDLVLTTSSHFGEVESALKTRDKLGMMAMRPATATVIELAKLDEGCKVGIVCASDIFAGLVRKNCSGIGQWSGSMPSHLLGSGTEKLRAFLGDKGAAILPEKFEVFASAEERRALQAFEEAGGRIISYNYTIDRGSFMYVESLIKRVINQKRSV